MIIRFDHRFDVIPFIFHYSVSKWEKRLEMLKQFAYKVWFNLKKICRYLFTDQQIKLVIIKLHKILFTQVLSVYESTEVRWWVTLMLVLFISSTESSISYQENSLESKQGIYYLFIVLIRSVWNSNTKIKRREKERKLKISMQIHINNKKSISIWRMQKKNSEMKRGISVNHSTHRIVGSSVYPKKSVDTFII